MNSNTIHSPSSLKSVIRHPMSIVLLISLALGCSILIYKIIDVAMKPMDTSTESILDQQSIDMILSIIRSLLLSFNIISLLIAALPFVGTLIMVIQSKNTAHTGTLKTGLLFHQIFAITQIVIFSVILLIVISVGLLISSMNNASTYTEYSSTLTRLRSLEAGTNLFIWCIFSIIRICWSITGIMVYSSSKQNELDSHYPIKAIKSFQILCILSFLYYTAIVIMDIILSINTSTTVFLHNIFWGIARESIS